jgi:hypothetical protein
LNFFPFESLLFLVLFLWLSNFLFIYSYVHIFLGHFSPLSSTPSVSPNPPHFQAEPVLPLSLILLNSRHKQ